MNPNNAAGSAELFDPRQHKLHQRRAVETTNTQYRKQTAVPLRKPSKQMWVRSHPNEEYRAESIPTLTDEITSEIYWIAGDLEIPAEIENLVSYLNLATAITPDGSVFIWHFKDSTNSWSESARLAIKESMTQWVRVIPDRQINGYVLEYPSTAIPEPKFPPVPFTELLAMAFGNRRIDTLRHPLIKRIRGDFSA